MNIKYEVKTKPVKVSYFFVESDFDYKGSWFPEYRCHCKKTTIHSSLV